MAVVVFVVFISIHTYGQTGIIAHRVAPIGVINFGEGAASGGASANFIDGYVRKQGEGSFIFPVGHNNVFAPFSVSGDGSMGAYYALNPGNASSANAFAGGPFPTTDMDNSLKLISPEFFWDINGDKMSALTLSWNLSNSVKSLMLEDITKLTIVGWNGSQWVTIPSYVDNVSLFGNVSSKDSGSITTLQPMRMDQYQVYTLGSLIPPALPVKLISFTGSVENRQGNLQWTTTEEINTDKFVVQTSPDSKSWRDLGSLKAGDMSSGTLKDQIRQYSFLHNDPVSGSNYYRLMMVDNDDTYAYSKIITLWLQGEAGITVYPNPASDLLFIKTRGNQEIKRTVFRSVLGNANFETKGNPINGISIKHLNEGVHFITVFTSDGGNEVHKIVVSR